MVPFLDKNKQKDQNKPQHLYIEEYYIKPNCEEETEKENHEEKDRGVIVIDIF